VTPVIVVHGGAGDRSLTGARAEAGLAAAGRALCAGSAVLVAGGTALDAVVAAVMVLEDDGSLNAGRGAVRTSAGTVELSASVMDGATRGAGGVAVAAGLRHPVEAARRVLREGGHVLFAGPAVAALAEGPVNDVVAPVDDAVVPGGVLDSPGTVGAVALDGEGHLAAATSTGGIRGQHPGRVGDSPVIGAGTWADDRTCAVSATGDGDAFLRAVFAHDVHARMVYGGLGLAAACDAALDAVSVLGGRGGCVAVDRLGNVAMPFTTSTMLRGWCTAGGEPAARLGFSQG
jgi:L-asparaginase / beta-aspartyl-peptidase